MKSTKRSNSLILFVITAILIFVFHIFFKPRMEYFEDLKEDKEDEDSDEEDSDEEDGEPETTFVSDDYKTRPYMTHLVQGTDVDNFKVYKRVWMFWGYNRGRNVDEFDECRSILSQDHSG